MELLQNIELVRREWTLTPYGQWSDDLRDICGNFNAHTYEGDKHVLGEALRIKACGMQFAHISNNVDYVQRDWNDIRHDTRENLFLILQLEGSCGIEHGGEQNLLYSGDCILLDSTKPTTFFFGGKFSNHLSLHLPRQIMYLHSKVNFDIARKLPNSDPMALMLRALIAKVMLMTEEDKASPHLRDLVYNAVGQAFISYGAEKGITADLHDNSVLRSQLTDSLIDQNLTESSLSAKWLAHKLGISIRTLQQDFQDMGVTCTMAIRNKRLHYVREQLEHFNERKGRNTIAEVAYSAGFNDISYFNRSFKEMFDCSPRDLLCSMRSLKT